MLLKGLEFLDSKLSSKYPGQITDLRKVKKAKRILLTDESLIKMLYFATIDITKNWTQVLRNWPIVLAQLSIYFDDRIDQNLF